MVHPQVVEHKTMLTRSIFFFGIANNLYWDIDSNCNLASLLEEHMTNEMTLLTLDDETSILLWDSE